ncbi:MAG: putative Histidine kinase, partial [Acidobacteria bacterium]|nr:putative Histidine kinase [Acidobacteriota bacterium]
MIGRRKRSIRGKLTGIIMIISTTAVLLACLGFTASGLLNLRKRRASDLSTTGEVIGANSTAALTFGDHEAAREVLGALRSKPSIIAACVYGKDGRPFARYAPEASTIIPRHLLPDGFHEDGDRLELYYPIRLDHERIGTLYLAADARDRDARLKQYGLIAGGIVLLSLLVAYVLAAMLQRAISEPIVELARVADLVSQHKNFSMRARHPGVDSDEIGNLMTGFN